MKEGEIVFWGLPCSQLRRLQGRALRPYAIAPFLRSVIAALDVAIPSLRNALRAPLQSLARNSGKSSSPHLHKSLNIVRIFYNSKRERISQ